MTAPADKPHLRLAVVHPPQPEPDLGDPQVARLASLGFMVAGVCHEVANPLTAVHSMVQLLQSSTPLSPETLASGLENIAANVQRVLNITRTLNDFSRAGATERARVAIDLPITSARQNALQHALFREVEIHITAAPELQVFAVADQIEQVFANILLNAAQAMNGAGCIHITSRRTDDKFVEVAMHDSGPGIAPGYLLRLLEPFFTTKPAGQGTGLGLAISNEIVMEHGGSLHVENHPQGGACVYVLLPALPNLPAHE